MYHGRCHWSRALCRVSGRACSCKKRPCYQNVENTSDNESNNEESSSDIENQEEEEEEEEEEEVASENGVEAEGTQESDNDTENDSQETESSSPETATTFHSKSPSKHCENIDHEMSQKLLARLLQDLSYMRSPDSRGEKVHQRRLSSVSRLRSSYTQKRVMTLETNFYSPSKEENEDED